MRPILTRDEYLAQRNGKKQILLLKKIRAGQDQRGRKPEGDETYEHHHRHGCRPYPC